MPPKSKRAKQLEEARQNKQATDVPTPKVDTDLFVLSTVMEGSTYAQESRKFASCGIDCCRSSTFYRHQQKICDEIKNHAKLQMKIYQNRIKDGAHLAGDSRYSHRTHATQNTYLVIDNDQKKCVAAFNTVREGGKRNGTFSSPSNMMETNGAKECVKQLQKLKFRNACFAHDNDNKTTAVLNASTNVKFEESLDRNHAVKAIERRFDKHFEKELKTINSKNAALNEFATNVVKDKSITDENIKSFMRKQTKNEPKIQKKHITPLRKHLVSWFVFLVTYITNIPKRIKLWLNAADHWVGDHTNCDHELELQKNVIKKKGRPPKNKDEYWTWKAGIEHPELHRSLKTFLQAEENYVRKVSITNTTQSCESLNSNIARTAPKNIAFGNSYNGRVWTAIGTQNNPHFKSEMIKIVDENHRVSPSLSQRLYYNESQAELLQQSRRTSFFRKRKNEQRKLFKQGNKTSVSGDYKGRN